LLIQQVTRSIPAVGTIYKKSISLEMLFLYLWICGNGAIAPEQPAFSRQLQSISPLHFIRQHHLLKAFIQVRIFYIRDLYSLI